MKKKFMILAVAVALMTGNSLTVCAAGDATVTFTENEKIEYSGVGYYKDGTPKLGSAFEGMAPGEIREQVITIQNNNDKTVDFYMNASALQALEDSAKQAKGAGYEIKLTVGDTVLYDSNVGGYASAGTEGSTEGIREMNEGALEGYMLIDTLSKKQAEKIKLSVFMDGEAMDNNSQAVDYSNALGQFGFSFRVAYDEPDAPTVIYKEVTRKGGTNYVKQIVEIIEERVPLAAVATADPAMIGGGIAVMLSGILLVVVAAKRNKKGEK